MKRVLFFCLMFTNIFSYSADVKKANVKIYVNGLKYDYSTPWSPGRQEKWTGSGFIIEGSKIITNAHVAANGSFIQVKKAGDSEKYTAKVKRICHDIDLAILEVEDEEFFKDTKPIDLGNTPIVGDEVMVYGFPMGGKGLSLTKGIVSRVEMMESRHSGISILACDMDAAITSGNSGGPVIKSGKVVGISFQGIFLKEGGYIISVELLKTMLEMDKKGKDYKITDIAVKGQSLENKNLKSSLNLDVKQKGIYIYDISDMSDINKYIKVGDVLTKIDQYDIDNDGTIEFRSGERISYEYAFNKKTIGDEIIIELIRNGKKIKQKVILSDQFSKLRHFFEMEYDKPPTYLIKGGIVFQPLVGNMGRRWANNKELSSLNGEFKSHKKPGVVVIEKILKDELTNGYNYNERKIVDEINGVKIFKIEDVNKAFDKDVEFHEIKLQSKEIIRLKAQGLSDQTIKIAERYGITKLSSDNL